MNLNARACTVAINTDAAKTWCELKHYHSVACLMLELGRKVLFPEMLGFNSATVTTPMRDTLGIVMKRKKGSETVW